MIEIPKDIILIMVTQYFYLELGSSLVTKKLYLKLMHQEDTKVLHCGLGQYSTASIRIPNPKLKPEGIDQIDLSVLGESKNKKLNWNVGLFGSRVFDAIKMKSIPSTSYSQHTNVDKYRIIGLLANFRNLKQKIQIQL